MVPTFRITPPADPDAPHPAPAPGQVYEHPDAASAGGSFLLIVTHVTTGKPARVFYKFPDPDHPDELKYAHSYPTRIDLWNDGADRRTYLGTTDDPDALRFIPSNRKLVNDI